MNIFKKIKYANKVLKLINDIKKHFNNNKVTEEAKKKVENFINALSDLGTIVPECKGEIAFIVDTIKNFFK